MYIQEINKMLATTVHNNNTSSPTSINPNNTNNNRLQQDDPPALGILQRYEQLRQQQQQEEAASICCSSSQQLEIITDSDTNPIRCPCCRGAPVKLICVNCLNQNVVRIAKIREEQRRLLLSKMAIGQLVQKALADEIKFEADFHKVSNSIETVRAQIAWRTDQCARLRQRIANTDAQTERNRRNVVLLEKKMISHAERINRTKVKNNELNTALMGTKSKLNSYILSIARFLFWLFRLERRHVDASAGPAMPAWTGQPPNKLRRQRSAFALNSCLCLARAELLAAAAALPSTDRQAAFFSPHSSPPSLPSSLHQQYPRESMAALRYAAQFAEQLAHILHFGLPYPRLHRCLMMLTTTAATASSAGSNDVGGGASRLLQQALFRLDYAVLHLCLARGVPAEQCELCEPLANLHALSALIGRERMSASVIRVDQRLHRQICEQFGAVQPDGRVFSEFTLDNVENDWVKVHCSQ